MVFADSRLTTGVFCSSLHDYDEALNLAEASKCEGCMQYEQNIYASLGFGSQKNQIRSFGLVPEERTGGKNSTLGKCYGRLNS